MDDEVGQRVGMKVGLPGTDSAPCRGILLAVLGGVDDSEFLQTCFLVLLGDLPQMVLLVPFGLRSNPLHWDLSLVIMEQYSAESSYKI